MGSTGATGATGLRVDRQLISRSSSAPVRRRQSPRLHWFDWRHRCAAGSELTARCAVRDGFRGSGATDLGRIFLADQNAGRLVVLDVADGGISERRGPARNDAVQVCPTNAMSGVANVSDVLAP